MKYSLHSDESIKKSHRVFGNPSASPLHNLLKREDSHRQQENVIKHFQKLIEELQACMKYGTKERQFNLIIGIADFKFSHIVALYVLYISGKPIIQPILAPEKFFENSS